MCGINNNINPSHNSFLRDWSNQRTVFWPIPIIAKNIYFAFFYNNSVNFVLVIMTYTRFVIFVIVDVLIEIIIGAISKIFMLPCFNDFSVSSKLLNSGVLKYANKYTTAVMQMQIIAFAIQMPMPDPGIIQQIPKHAAPATIVSKVCNAYLSQ